MVARRTYGAGISEQARKRTEQRYCECGAPIPSNKKRCLDCAAKADNARRNARRKRRADKG